MQEVTFEQVVKLAEQLSTSEQAALIQRLQAQTAGQQLRARLDAEHQRRLASGAFEQVGSLRNKYARDAFDISDAELITGIREFSNEWEQRLDDLIKPD